MFTVTKFSQDPIGVVNLFVRETVGTALQSNFRWFERTVWDAQTSDRNNHCSLNHNTGEAAKSWLAAQNSRNEAALGLRKSNKYIRLVLQFKTVCKGA